MSFAVQEELLLALLFDRALRGRFVADAPAVLAAFDLSDEERQDFLCIRTDGLEFDASLRIDLILSQQVKTWPLTFALLSSITGGLEGLKLLVDRAFILERPAQRAVHLGLRLRDWLPQLAGLPQQEYGLVNAVLEAELAMAYNAANLKAEKAPLQASGIALPADWQQLPVALAAHVSVSVIPWPYARLKQALCPCEGPALWHYLSATPVPAAVRRQLLLQPDMRLLLARAYVADASPTDPVVDFVTMELAQGYAPLFQYVNGGHSVADILAQMQMAGAQAGLLEGIRNGFRQMLEKGLLQVG